VRSLSAFERDEDAPAEPFNFHNAVLGFGIHA
jgi:hypothetical protein